MNQALWTSVDHFLDGLLLDRDPILDEALQASAAAGLPEIQVSPGQGKFLALLAQLQGARSILEIGALGGYSTIWLARALPPDGSLVTLEVDPRHAQVAQENLERAGLKSKVEVWVGPALDNLPVLAAQGRGPFDLIFIDADKPNNVRYFQWALKLSRRGSLIIIDNVIRDGFVADPVHNDPGVLGARRLIEAIAAEPRVSASVLQTVGRKGYDGFALALVIANP